MNRWLLRLVGRATLTHRTVRWRLAALYSALFLASGAALLTISYVLVDHATAGTFTYHDDNGFVAAARTGTPETSAPPEVSVQSSDGAVQALTPQQAEELNTRLQQLADEQHHQQMRRLLTQSGIALGAMTLLSLAAGWLMAGRVLRPLRTMAQVTRSITATNLHQRLHQAGPDDELRALSDTIDALLDRIEQAFEAQRRFVANASHELRTPLTVSRALLQMVLTDPDATTEQFRTACDQALEEATHQEHLLEALLVLARSERGLANRTRLDLAELAEPVIEAQRSRAAAAGVHLSAGLDAAPLDGDAHLLERLVVNLVDNAVRYNTAGGTVHVTTGTDGGRATLRVENTGPVVPDTDLDRLLQPFQRLDGDSPAAPDGHGLGLSIVAAIAQAHGADLRLHPREDGGLRAHVVFAALVPAPVPAPRRQLDVHLAASSS